MPFRLLSSPVSVNKRQDRALTLVFGSDGQVSLIGFDDGVTSQPLRTFAASNIGASTVSPIPNLDVTSASLTGASSSTVIPTSTPISPSTGSSYGPSVNATNTDTNLPSIPTVNYPTPTPTPVSNPKDHGVGAPFYLAIVLASISFIGCVSALIAWWIRSRSRKRDLELEDPWLHSSDAGSPSTDNMYGSEKGPQTLVGAQTRPYYLPASIVHRSSSNLLAVPHTIPVLNDGTPQNGITRTALGPRVSRPTNDVRSQNSNFEPNTSTASSRPGVERLQSELSVQESTHTLGRLRVANRVPGDITSGDEGAMNIPRLQQTARIVPDANIGKVNATLAGENANDVGSDSRPFTQEGGDLLGPPGPATTSWGRRMDNVAALRRTRRRVPETTVKTYKNPLYSGYLGSTPDASLGGTTRTPLARNDREEKEMAVANHLPDPLRWTSTLKSSFWQAVDAMTGNRSPDSEPRAMDPGNGSRFTPAPQRAASRRSPVSPTPVTAGTSFRDTHAVRSQQMEANYKVSPETSVVSQENPQNLIHSSFDGFLMRAHELGVPHTREGTVGRVDSLFPGASAPNNVPSARTHRGHPDSVTVDTGSLYSTDSAAARANLRKYGYGDGIPSTWSALGATRESQLDLARMFLPLPRLITTPSPNSGPLSITPSQVTLRSSLRSDSVSTPLHSDRGSENNTLRSGKSGNTVIYGETPLVSEYSVSRNGTIQSAERGTGNAPLQITSSTTSSMLSRKKGVATRRKRPSPPARASSTASSVQSVESGLSIREVAVKRALLERRKKVKAAGSLKRREDREDGSVRS